MHRATQQTAPPATAHTYDQRLTFDLTTPSQTAWQGVCANYAGIAAFPTYGLSPSQITAEWDRVQRSGVRIVSTWYDESWAMPTYPTGSPNWSSAEMTAFYAFLQAMQDRGIQVMIKMGWHFPQNVGALSGAAPITPTPANEATFAAWVSESLNQFFNVQHFTCVVGCFFFTEPNAAPIGTIPGGYGSPQEYYAHVVTVARDKIVTDDGGRTPIRPRITINGPSEFSFTVDTWTQYLKANTTALFDGYSAHSYCQTPNFAPLSLTASQCLAYQNWTDLFTGWVGDANPQPMYPDESGFLVGGDTDSTGYRATADAGWQWVRQIVGHMRAGAQASYPWLLADQPILGGTVLQYGTYRWVVDSTDVKPSWYAISMLANLSGGGGATHLFSATGGTSTVHGIGVFIPQGQPHTTDPRGDYSVVVINEGSTALDISVDLGSSIGGRTVYRYAYSGEYVPPSATDPAYLTPWNQRMLSVASVIPTTRHSGHSVVIYSTINLAAPVAENLALTATASSDSTAQAAVPYATAFGNPSNVNASAANGWRKAADASHYLQLAWGSAQTIGRVTLAFAGTTAGIVYATYADSSTPSPVSDYTLQYWDGATWQTLATVSGNTAPNKSHTFGPVSTTMLRVNVTSVAATANVNDFGVFAS